MLYSQFKLLPMFAGASVVADGMGYAATDVEFFALTGLGDGAGVLVGHTAFYALKVSWRSQFLLRSMAAFPLSSLIPISSPFALILILLPIPLSLSLLTVHDRL